MAPNSSLALCGDVVVSRALVYGTLELEDESSLVVTDSLDVWGVMLVGHANVTAHSFALYNASKLRVTQGATITVENLFLNGGDVCATVTTSFYGLRKRDTIFVTLQSSLVNYTHREGTFGDSSATLNYTFSSCDSIKSSIVSYSASSAMVLVDVSRDISKTNCGVDSSSRALSTGAIVGISLGAAAFAAIIATILLIFCRKLELERKSAIIKAEIRMKYESGLPVMTQRESESVISVSNFQTARQSNRDTDNIKKLERELALAKQERNE